MNLQTPGYRDHFSQCAASYAAFRPRYPADLFAYLSTQSPARQRAWDCATGNGQAALGLAAHFQRVVASDASGEQIAHARPHARVAYLVAEASQSGLRAGTVDLVTVAQALHWLDKEPFFSEASRVLRPGGVVAVWCYSLARIAPDIDEIVRALYVDVLRDYWPRERSEVDTGYAGVAMPFREIETPAFLVRQEWTIDQMAGYIRTWSAVRRYVQRRGEDPATQAIEEMKPLWGPHVKREVRWQLHLRLGRK